MIALSATAKGEKRLAKLLGGNSKKLRREIAIAVNATSRKTVSLWAKAVSKEVATTQSNIKKTIKVSSKADPGSVRPKAVVRQKETARIPLRDFGARQNKKGVAYRIAKGGKRQFIPGAFIVNSLGGHVFARVGPKVKATKGRYEGMMRQKIDKKYGPSPWGVSLKNKLTLPVGRATRIELLKQIERRTRFIKLKQSGAI